MISDPNRLQATDAVDLHLHTIASDGFWTPDGLIAYLADRGFRVAAVCDHDTQRSVVEAMRLGEERGVAIVPGVEVTCRWEERQLHLLVYGIRPDRTDDDAAPFLRLLARIDEDLHEKALDGRERFEGSGRALPSLEEIRNGRTLWPFHVLSAAIKDAHAPNLKESAELLVRLGGEFSADLPLGEVVEAAHRAGGVCIIAHPGRADAVGVVTEADLDRLRAEFAIEGLEAHYRSHSAEQTALYRRLAAEREMVVSCGSDSHAAGMPVDPRPWPAGWCAALLERLGFRVEGVKPDAWESAADQLAAAPEPEKTGDGDTPEEPLMDVENALESAAKGG